MAWESIQSLARHALTFGGGFLVSAGFFDAATVDSLVAAAMTIIGVVWSLVNKKQLTSS